METYRIQVRLTGLNSRKIYHIAVPCCNTSACPYTQSLGTDTFASLKNRK